MRIGLLTTIWGRPELTELVINYYNDLDVPGVDLLCVGVYSNDDDNPSFANSTIYDRWHFEEYPNQPLSDKWNRGMLAMRDCDVDAVLIAGSDDLISVKYIQACAYCVKRAKQYIYLPGCYFLDLETMRCMWAWARRLGLGRCLSRSLLNELEWQPWPMGVKEGLDGAMTEKMRNLFPDFVNLRFARDQGYATLDIKSGHNMWGYDFVKDNLDCEEVEPVQLLEEYFPSVSTQLLNWNGSRTITGGRQVATG